MNRMSQFRSRLPLLLAGLLLLAAVAALPFAAQQPLPFDENRIVNDLTNSLQLAPEQTARLNELLATRRPRIDSLLQQMGRLQPGTPSFADLRGQLERERRAVLEEFLPTLRPEQQTRLRGLLSNLPPQQPFTPLVNLAPVKPNLPTGALAAGEKLIPLPANEPAQTRSRRPNTTAAQLTEDQKILHVLNRAGFGPRPGDLERIQQMGLERYLDEQLHPEDINDDLLTRPLQALNTLQLSIPETIQTYAPPPPRPVPTPTPTPAPTPKKDSEPEKPAQTLSAITTSTSGTASEKDAPQEKPREEMPKEEKKDEKKLVSTPTPTPRPTATPVRPPTPPRNPQQPVIELQQAKLLRAVFSEKQLQEVMVDFWFNHFNVFAGKDNARWMLSSYERDVIRPYALGNFKELLLAVAQSPAMMVYLDNFLSQAELPPPPPRFDADGNPLPQPRRGGLNENYARELMELHTLGVDGGYTQKDVTEVARCFTGWTVNQQPNSLFVFRPRTHDRGEKLVLGKRIAPGGGIEDGLRVLDLLAKHPSTAKFIARKLCQRFVADEPPQPLVDRAATAFTQTGGDIRQVVRTILTAPEFYSPKVYRNKIKSPLELAASALRATGATTDGAQPLIQWVARMGEPLYQCQPPTGYAEESARWLSNATLLERMNFGLALLGNKINGTRTDVARLVSPALLQAPGKEPNHLLDELVAVLIHSEVSPETYANLRRVLDENRAKLTPASYDARAATQRNTEFVGSLAALLLGAREFQVK